MNRLGDRIRASAGLLAEDDRALLEQVLGEHLEVLERVVEIVEAGLRPRQLQPTPRLKSDKTLIEKLLREEGMELGRMEDIAGIRIVDEMTRSQQDELIRRIAGLFESTRIIDRRADPRAGYRAVHIRVSLDQRFVEIQVRTMDQDQWAQAFEALGDRWGRQIRYGEPPDDPDRAVPGDGSRLEFVRQMLSLSDLMADQEQVEDRMSRLEQRVHEISSGPSSPELLEELQAIRDDMESGVTDTHENTARMAEFTTWFRRVAEARSAIGESG
jgi:hypothetical protein